MNWQVQNSKITKAQSSRRPTSDSWWVRLYYFHINSSRCWSKFWSVPSLFWFYQNSFGSVSHSSSNRNFEFWIVVNQGNIAFTFKYWHFNFVSKNRKLLTPKRFTFGSFFITPLAWFLRTNQSFPFLHPFRFAVLFIRCPSGHLPFGFISFIPRISHSFLNSQINKILTFRSGFFHVMPNTVSSSISLSPI